MSEKLELTKEERILLAKRQWYYRNHQEQKDKLLMNYYIRRNSKKCELCGEVCKYFCDGSPLPYERVCYECYQKVVLPAKKRIQK
jgi:ferredoxin